MDAELREWMGIAPADFPVYLAVACIGLTYFTGPGVLDSALVLIAVISCIASCIVGMKHDTNVSAFTNGAKLIAYPICLVGCIVLAAANFLFWN